MKRLIVWGAGELGGRVARLWRKQGEAVIGLTQSPKRHANLAAMGVEPGLGNPLGLVRVEDTLLLALPGHTNQGNAIELLRRHHIKPPARVTMISSTGYYGMAQGFIDEKTAAGPDPRSATIASAETAFRAWAGENGVIIRCGGLYRQGRGPLAVLARRCAPRLGPPDKTLALIHYDDAASATFAALRHPNPETVYLAVTPPCPTRQVFYQQACTLLGLPQPRFDTALGGAPASFDITRLRRDLLPTPAHPDWRVALQL